MVYLFFIATPRFSQPRQPTQAAFPRPWGSPLLADRLGAKARPNATETPREEHGNMWMLLLLLLLSFQGTMFCFFFFTIGIDLAYGIDIDDCADFFGRYRVGLLVCLLVYEAHEHSRDYMFQLQGTLYLNVFDSFVHIV